MKEKLSKCRKICCVESTWNIEQKEYEVESEHNLVELWQHRSND